jgi:carotenoid cleavage dioxygenase-like enzyme
MATTTGTTNTTRTTAGVGASKGFESLEDEIRVGSLPVHGEIPAWLYGSLIRTGPAKWEVGDRAMNHWFDGFAMLHRFSFSDQKVSYANRFLETHAYRAARDEGRISYSEFATDPCRSLFQRVSAMFSPQLSDNANVNLVKLGEEFIAMTETPIPVQFDPDTLTAAGVAYDPPGQLTTAHPHMDRATKGMLNYAAKLGPKSSYRFFRIRPGSQTPELLGQAPVKRPAYMHSFGMTPRWLVLAEFPFVVNPLSLALSGRPYIENYNWKPELGTTFHLFDRNGGQVLGPFKTDARFAFHHVNSYEDGDEVVVDLCTFADAQVIEDLYLERLREGKPVAPAHVERFRITPGDATVTSERLLDEPLELPRINYMRCNERPYRYVWGVGIGSGWLDRIVKGDVMQRRSTVWSEDGCFPGEPVFVASPDAREEDDGVLLSVVLDGHTGRSFLLVLDAHSLEELARAEVPHHIPFGFHGQFAR